MFRTNTVVKVDKAHAEVLYGLVCGQKPTNVLELGLGAGESTDAILRALQQNEQPYQYTLVDNWADHGHRMPDGVMELYGSKVSIVTANEKDFVFQCRDTYDFIFSDADHQHANEWFEYVYDHLLRPEGILLYHDINLLEPFLPNLLEIYYTCIQKKYHFKLFNRNSIPGERCHRGLLAIFKH